MAELDTSQGKGGGGKSKKMSTRVDLTPMVDLAFLLITFFMLTTTMNKPQVMEINMPVKPKAEDPKPPEVEASRVLTVILGKDNTVWYYEGLEAPEIKNANYQDIRKVILDKKAAVEANPAFGKDKTVVIIKPTDDAIYKNIVDMLDEMAIDGIKIYAMVPVTKTELDLVGKGNTEANKTPK
ncbi:MAG TPA: biopolymer transporter ExbD [Saprospiraceae bacterium]|nr:biopolymer transporter ExbD [Saprospiraceae bacterium]HQW55296.1 biopolymer transporter ExbD [Saprospiraceae bacterium]